MVKTIGLKFIDFQNALKSLEEVLVMEKNNVVRDSIIKRFEYTYELCWKTGKILLSEKFGVEVFSPKECFRELGRNQLIDDEALTGFLKMTDDRNDIVHAYNEGLSEWPSDKIKENYLDLFLAIKQAFTKEIG